MNQREIWERPESGPDWKVTRTPDEWGDVKHEQKHRKNMITQTRSVLDVRKYGLRLEFTEWAVFENGKRIADGFNSRESAIEYARN
jgi:hypothetical protein